MTRRVRSALWVFWLTGTAGLVVYLGLTMARGEDAQVFLPGKTSHGHYQIETKCHVCHTPMMGVKQEACLTCHATELEAAHDAHPPKKFTDPRNADRVAALDARLCVTCHREHVPDFTRPSGVTMPLDYCSRCHANIGDERPSHVGLAFQTCHTAGCHNFHDNRALYEDFLVQHAAERDLAERAVTPLRDFARRALQEHPDRQRNLTIATHNGPHHRTYEPQLLAAWADTAHARAGINCLACHGDTVAGTAWVEHPRHTLCATCHQVETDGFLGGHHGMRLAQELSPMTPAQARIPMKREAAHLQMTCAACHSAHAFDTRKAAVEACMACHDDAHTRAYIHAPHYRLWQQEVAGTAAAGTGVSCATCHLPRQVHRHSGTQSVIVQHNQNDNLRPNEKMLRSVCMHCHGLRFSIDALADPALVANNFRGQPSRYIASIDWAIRRVKTAQPGVREKQK